MYTLFSHFSVLSRATDNALGPAILQSTDFALESPGINHFWDFGDHSNSWQLHYVG